jgi:hypothetical protein
MTWTYSSYRALLRRNGKAFAIVTPDGTNALSNTDAKVLLSALNGRPKRRKKEALANLYKLL